MRVNSPFRKFEILFAIKAAVFLVFVCQWAAAQTFDEAEGYSRDAEIDSIAGWSSSAANTASISDGQAAAGDQSLEISKHAEGAYVERAYTHSPDGIAFIDFWIRPSVNVDSPTVAVEADGAMIGFIGASKKEGEVVCGVSQSDGSIENISTGYRFSMKPKGEATEWLRLTIRRDRAGQIWDLFVNGELAAINIPAPSNFNSNTASLRFYAGADPVYVDEVEITDFNVLSPDADKDGMPDLYEKTFGLKPYVNDRTADSDADGVPNFLEYFEGTRPDAKPGTEGNVIYVDNTCGRDSNRGASFSAAAGELGPKKSISEALANASRGDIVMILKGDGLYVVDSLKTFAPDIKLRFEESGTTVTGQHEN